MVTSLGPNPNRALIVLNRGFTHGILRTRELFSAGEREFMSGCAYDVWVGVKLLRAEQVPFRIEPDFPYDLDARDPLTDHDHDWQPI